MWPDHSYRIQESNYNCLFLYWILFKLGRPLFFEKNIIVYWQRDPLENVACFSWLREYAAQHYVCQHLSQCPLKFLSSFSKIPFLRPFFKIFHLIKPMHLMPQCRTASLSKMAFHAPLSAFLREKVSTVEVFLNQGSTEA